MADEETEPTASPEPPPTRGGRKTKRKYRVLVGLSYPPNGKGARVDAAVGDTVDDLPPKSVPDLLAQKWIEEA